jgi:hypothetical protein
VFIETDSIDENNIIFKENTIFTYDYEIIKDGKRLKLKNSFNEFIEHSIDLHANFRLHFEYVNADLDSIPIDKILLVITPLSQGGVYPERTHYNQTQAIFLTQPKFWDTDVTGLVENSTNVWMHPIREGYFQALQTCPFPYIKQPYSVGSTWADSMSIGYGKDTGIGEWPGDYATLHYSYKIIDKKAVETKIGNLDCFIVESTAKSEYFETTLTTYFSEKYGFVRLEYTLINGIKINLWIDKVEENEKLNDVKTFSDVKQFFLTK